MTADLCFMYTCSTIPTGMTACSECYSDCSNGPTYNGNRPNGCPAGALHAWCSRMLSYLEHAGLASMIPNRLFYCTFENQKQNSARVLLEVEKLQEQMQWVMKCWKWQTEVAVTFPTRCIASGSCVACVKKLCNFVEVAQPATANVPMPQTVNATVPLITELLIEKQMHSFQFVSWWWRHRGMKTFWLAWSFKINDLWSTIF